MYIFSNLYWQSARTCIRRRYVAFQLALRRIASMTLAVALCFTLAAPSAMSQTIAAGNVYGAITGKLALDDSLFFEMFESPVLIDDYWNILNSNQLAMRMSDIADRAYRVGTGVPPTSYSGGAFDIYRGVLEKASWGTLILTTEEQKQFDSDKKLLFKQYPQKTPSELHKNYQQLKSAYETAQAAWDQTPEADRTESQRIQLEQARVDLELKGQATRIEAALDRIESIEAAFPESVRQKLLKQLANNTSPDGKPVYEINVSDAETSAGWLPVEIAAPTANQVEERRWRWCGASNFSASDPTEKPDLSGMKISFVMRIFPIFRPGMDMNLFWFRSWKFNGLPTGHISSGWSNGGNVTGSLPMIIADAVLIKDIVITGASTRERTAIARAMAAGHCVGLGPLSILRSAIPPDAANFVIPNGDSLIVSGFQAIGILGRKLPRAPDPDNKRFSW